MKISKKGFVTLPKARDEKLNAAGAMLEDAVSYFNYAALENDQGTKDPKMDLEVARDFLREALMEIEEILS